MATLRKANAYSKRKVTPFTRTSKRRQRAYIKTNPPQKVVKFNMGNTAALKADKYPLVLTAAAEEKCQIRHNALEACRQYVNKKMDKETNKNYFFKIIPYPHHIQRENKMLTGAGADRMSDGMRNSFGKTTGKAAIVKEGSEIFKIYVSTPKEVAFARKTLKQIQSKLPCKIKITSEDMSKVA